MINSQSSAITEDLNYVLKKLPDGFYLTDETENEIVSIKATGPWIIELIYANNESSFVHCSNIRIFSKKR
ncbi:hypothetical protein CXM95_08375 [Enterococcus sp. CR-Ec1]|nr:hypothetical protein CXM95_08375 [Enterococcus sp. CR-Ec1]